MVTFLAYIFALGMVTLVEFVAEEAALAAFHF